MEIVKGVLDSIFSLTVLAPFFYHTPLRMLAKVYFNATAALECLKPLVQIQCKV